MPPHPDVAGIAAGIAANGDFTPTQLVAQMKANAQPASSNFDYGDGDGDPPADLATVVNCKGSTPVLNAPFCETVKNSCNSGRRLQGRGDVGGNGKLDMGSELMQPNTLDDCQDASYGQPNDISIQKIVVKSVALDSNDKLPLLQEGLEAEIIVKVQARANPYGESRGFVYSATDAYDPIWKYVGDFTIWKSGTKTRTVRYKIPSGTGEEGVQAVRVRFGFNIGKGRCWGGGDGNLYADVDDLAFAVQPAPVPTLTEKPTISWPPPTEKPTISWPPTSTPSYSPSSTPSVISSSYTSRTMLGIRKLYDDLKEILFGK